MKFLLKQTAKIVLLLTLFSLVNCERDDELVTTKQEQSLLSVKKIGVQEINTNGKLNSSLEKIAKKEIEEDVQNKFVSSNGYNFHVKTSEAIYIENGSYNSYTFSIYREDNNDLIENLFLSLQEDGNYKASIVQYGIEEDGSISENTFYNIIDLGDTFDSDNVINELSKDSGCVFDYATALGDDNIEYATTAACEAVNGDDGCGRIVIHYVHNSCPNTIAAAPGFNGGGANTGDPGNTVDTNNNSVNYVNYTGTNYYNNTSTGSNNNDTSGGNVVDYNQVGAGVNNQGTTVTLVNNARPILKAIPNLTEQQKIWLTIFAGSDTVDVLNNFVLNNLDEDEFVIDLIEILREEVTIDQNALSFMLEAKAQDKFYNSLDSAFLISVDEFMAADITQNNTSCPGCIQFQIYFTAECAMLRYNNPDWSDAKIYWEASKGMVHITLDVFGLIPVIGEAADLTNGVLYTIEGDGLNATLSYASAVPIAGWAAVGTKYAVKVVDATQTAYAISTKVKLTWKVLANGTIYFGSTGSKLRKVLGMAPYAQDARQAHHIIPWGKRTNEVVQKAAKSENAFHINEALNGIPLDNIVHLGSHSNYDARVVDFLNQLPANATPDQAYVHITTLINNIRTAIANNPMTPLNNLIF